MVASKSQRRKNRKTKKDAYRRAHVQQCSQSQTSPKQGWGRPVFVDELQPLIMRVLVDEVGNGVIAKEPELLLVIQVNGKEYTAAFTRDFSPRLGDFKSETFELSTPNGAYISTVLGLPHPETSKGTLVLLTKDDDSSRLDGGVGTRNKLMSVMGQVIANNPSVFEPIASSYRTLWGSANVIDLLTADCLIPFDLFLTSLKER